ncbi:hypothetical protein M407DRAFT_64709, partial [Tulasnella calospora MUT 4182]
AWFVNPQLSPLKDIPGPEAYESLIWGNLRRVLGGGNEVYRGWFESYGPNVHYRGLLLARRLVTKDPKAISYILNHSYNFPKPAQTRNALSAIFGEGDVHKRQRKIINPCFGPAQMKDLQPIIYDKAFQVRVNLHGVLAALEDGGNERKEVDVLLWPTRATLDMIGLVGFDYEFNSLTEFERDELVRAFIDVFAPSSSPNMLGLLAYYFPILKFIPNERAKAIARSKAVMRRIGTKLVKDKREAILASSGVDKIGKKSVVGRDLLTVLIKANMATDVKDSERLTDQEVMDQISTMLIAGHETTSTSLAWLLYDLAHPKYRHVQERLRSELRSLDTDRPTTEQLNSLPYLDAIVRENLRKNAVVDGTIRCAGMDEVIPVALPFVDRRGEVRREIRVGAGEDILISIGELNRDKEIWGDDAHDFNPQRWLDGSKPGPRSSEVPGVFSSILTFLSGPRACIGYRLALLEMKVILFAIMRDIAFELPDPVLHIEKKAM